MPSMARKDSPVGDASSALTTEGSVLDRRCPPTCLWSIVHVGGGEPVRAWRLERPRWA